MYQGVYHGKSVHPPDLDAVLQRSYDGGLSKVWDTAVHDVTQKQQKHN